MTNNVCRAFKHSRGAGVRNKYGDEKEGRPQSCRVRIFLVEVQFARLRPPMLDSICEDRKGGRRLCRTQLLWRS